MLYTFKSGATGDVIMTGARGDQLLAIIGKPAAPRGIVAAAALPAAIQALEQAVASDERGGAEAADGAGDGARWREAVTLRQRAWPLVEMFKRARAAQVAVVWGV